MTNADKSLASALQHHQAGRLAEAEPLYRRVLRAQPNHVDALQLLGLILHQQGRTEQAIDHLRRALRVKPDYAEVHNNLGNMLMEQSKWDEAIASFREAIRVKPGYAQAYGNLANTLSKFGVALLREGRPADAKACYEEVLRIQPNQAEAHNNLGIAYKSLGQLNAAAACYQNALRCDPGHIESLYNLGNVLMDQGRIAEAQTSFEEAVRRRPDYAEAHNNFGIVLKEQNRIEEALTRYREALRLRPEFSDAWNNVGVALHRLANLDDAVAAFDNALRFEPENAGAWTNLGNLRKDRGEMAEALDAFRTAAHLAPDRAAFDGNYVFSLCYVPGHDAHAIREEHRRWNQRHAAAFGLSIRPHLNQRDPDRRLRIGYVSPDFRDHVVGRNVWPLFREHDHSQVQVVAYANVLNPDAMTESFQRQCEGWRSIVGQSDEAVAEQIRVDGIDILVDLALHTAGNRLLVFARKPAPVQVTFAGYPGTTGLTTIDCRLTDPYLDPPGEHDDWYTETSIRLPDSFWCFDSLGEEPPVSELPALSRSSITLGCLNTFCKINAETLRLWARVMRALEGSRLVLLTGAGGHRQRTLDLLAAEGIAADLVSFVAPRARPQYLQLYHDVDLVLDTLPYNGHSTSLDALWMGVPVVTQVGETVVGRAGFSQLNNLGLGELVGATAEQFVTIAVTLAMNLPRLRELRHTLRERMRSSPLMDAKRFTRSIEAAYRQMWRTWCSGSGG
jgi:predicted O-linked N-acetylglucosamine transferase (SPINDLY family)